MTAHKPFKLRLFLWRWHRRLGLLAAILLLLVAVTGIQLNHIETLNWDNRPVQSEWLLQLYGVVRPPIKSIQSQDVWYSDIDDGAVYRNGERLASCAGGMVGVAPAQSWQVVACTSELLLVTNEGQLIERIGHSAGAPDKIQAIATCEGQFCLKSDNRWYGFDLNTLALEDEFSGLVSALPVAEPPKALQAHLQSLQSAVGITWERVVLDLHSGRLLGGVWVMDFAAIGLILLSLSGIWLWASGASKRWKRRH
ncbi:PepSY domain-containing protein [Gilvimarinus sp. SDUM040013]|uniref:PepSY domain-containing protein n=1 Tax=Gilvimarinus gilvus TaxID=3058038 RepID=A0ABU4RX71_9GAMM|nr:PepSY domain-containing protein [Gilvimarinus sp. SDUM040013]MDO3386650.1 PepSY domain-containing protein [Gilvimarinus sp. SDUM040013]MDX6849463.1 PepSY domain-containing protein [Gilvimarinus sp. SDUM040013]